MPPHPDLLVLGGGGHAAVVIEALRLAGNRMNIGIIEADESKIGLRIFDATVVGLDSDIPRLMEMGARYFAMGIAGAPDRGLRPRLYKKALLAGLQPMSVIHPSSVISPNAELAAGVQVLATAVVNARASIGAGAIVNTAAVVEHDCAVGSFAHLATGSRLAGGAIIRESAHVGAGAVVLQQIEIGAWSVVAAGAVVTRSVREKSTVAGIPAKEILK